MNDRSKPEFCPRCAHEWHEDGCIQCKCTGRKCRQMLRELKVPQVMPKKKAPRGHTAPMFPTDQWIKLGFVLGGAQVGSRQFLAGFVDKNVTPHAYRYELTGEPSYRMFQNVNHPVLYGWVSKNGNVIRYAMGLAAILEFDATDQSRTRIKVGPVPDHWVRETLRGRGMAHLRDQSIEDVDPYDSLRDPFHVCCEEGQRFVDGIKWDLLRADRGVKGTALVRKPCLKCSVRTSDRFRWLGPFRRIPLSILRRVLNVQGLVPLPHPQKRDVEYDRQCRMEKMMARHMIKEVDEMDGYDG